MEIAKERTFIAKSKVKIGPGLTTEIFCLVAISNFLLSGCQSNNFSQPMHTVGGVIEGDCTRIGVPFAGRVVSVAAKEGTPIGKNEELLHLDEEPLAKQLRWTEKLIKTAIEEKVRTKVLLDDLNNSLKHPASPISAGAGTAKLPPNFSQLLIQSNTNLPIRDSAASPEGAGSTPETPGTAPELKELDQAEDFQLKLIADAERSMTATVDSAFQQQFKLLSEARTQALQENAKNKYFGLNPAYKAKEKAIAAVFDAKEAALNSAHNVQRQAIVEVIADKKSALKETINTKRMALKEMKAGKNSIAVQITQERKQIEATMLGQQKRFGSIISSLGIGQQLALQKLNLAERNGKHKMVTMQIDQAQARLALIDTELTKAQAIRDEIASKLELCSIKSPLSGICISRSVQPGELVAPGPTLLKVLDQKSLYARAFVSEAELHTIKIGQTADLHFDGQAAKTIPAKIVSIDSHPCFSPERIYFKEDRVKQAYGIKLSFQDNAGFAKPGMPVDVQLAIIEHAR